MTVYEEIHGMISNRTIEEFFDYVIAEQKNLLLDDNQLSKIVGENNEEDNISNNYSGKPQSKKDTVKDSKDVERYPRDTKISSNALMLAKYRCGNYADHISFIRKSNSKNYTEPHHLIPVSAHKDFKYSLDVEENICSLCSTCHNCIHYGIDSEKEKMILKLYNKRKEMLKNVGLEISFSKLKSYYNI